MRAVFCVWLSEDAVILFHFTYPEHLDAILREGLVPADGSASGCEWILAGRKAVWLTAVPTLVPTRQAREVLLRRGIVFKVGSSNLPLATVCLEVRIPTHDRHLKKFNQWSRRNPEIKQDAGSQAIYENHWLYFGAVPPSRITVHQA
jgi:hypothetical protein